METIEETKFLLTHDFVRKTEKDGYYREYWVLAGTEIKDGDYKSYFSNGKLFQESQYIDDLPQGTYIEYGDDGEVVERSFLVNGVIDEVSR